MLKYLLIVATGAAVSTVVQMAVRASYAQQYRIGFEDGAREALRRLQQQGAVK